MNKLAKKSLSAACAVFMLSAFSIDVYAGSIPQGTGPVAVVQKSNENRKNIELPILNNVKLSDFTSVEKMVSSFYVVVLGRAASQDEINYYAKVLNEGTAVADVLGGFLNSKEFTDKGTSNEQYVAILYRAVLGRQASSSEISYYTDLLNGGSTRSEMFAGFTSSSEFAEKCSALGLTATSSTSNAGGETSPGAHFDETGLRSYVNRLYTMVLGRSASEDEVRERVDQLMNGSTAGQMASEFFGSSEFAEKNHSTSEYVKVLYRTILDRGPSASEIEYYVNAIEVDGFSRRLVLRNFIGSPEFSNLCAGYGIEPGTIELSLYDENPEINKFVVRQYKLVLGRGGASEAEVRERTEQLLTWSNASQMTLEFFSSPEFTNRNLKDEQYIEVLYRALLGRGPSKAEVQGYVDFLNNGASRNYLFSCFINSNEFARICSDYGVAVGTVTVPNSVPPSYGGNDAGNDETPWDGEKLTVRYNGKNVTDTVENILVQTVYAEVGGFRNTEVYKAQAVAAYTFIRYQNSRGNIPSLPLNTPSDSVKSEILSAVRSVKGQSITYNGSLAQTTYYAMSNGKTNNSADIWKTNLPYLVSVDSKYDVNATNYKVTKTFTMAQFESIMDKIYGGRSMWYENVKGKTADKWITTTKNSAGYVTSINLCGRTPSTEYFYQTMFGLRSAAFDVSYNSSTNSFTFTTYGYGHGVGMSQWGAYYYAVNEGWGYEKILAHYYPGTKLTKE